MRSVASKPARLERLSRLCDGGLFEFQTKGAVLSSR
jgi:hypothetical protein